MILFFKNKNLPKDEYEEVFRSEDYICEFVAPLQSSFCGLDALYDALYSSSEPKWSGIICTSQRAVEALQQCMKGKESEKIVNGVIDVYAVGPATASKMQKLGFNKVRGSDASGNAEQLAEFIINGRDRSLLLEKPLLFLVGDKTRDVMVDKLTIAQIPVTTLQVYKTEQRSDAISELNSIITRANQQNGVFWCVFFSPSGIDVVKDCLLSISEIEIIRIASIGQTTAKHARSLGFTVDAIAQRPTASSLCESIKFREK